MKFLALEDIELWKLVAQGNQEAFSHIYSTYSKNLYKYGLKFTQNVDLIEDVIQDVYVHIWELRESIFIQKSIKFYLFSSFRRELVKRNQAAQKLDHFDDFNSNLLWQASFEEVLLENQISLESSNKISKALDSLSGRQKEAIFLRYIQELSYEEISLLMGIQVPSLYNLIFKGIKSMKDFLTSSNFTAKVIGLILLIS